MREEKLSNSCVCLIVQFDTILARSTRFDFLIIILEKERNRAQHESRAAGLNFAIRDEGVTIFSLRTRLF